MRGLCASLAVLAALAGCGNELCAGVDGACVALAVRGAGEIDGLDITLSGAASGRRVAPGRAEVARLPVHVALALPELEPGPLSIRVVAVRLGAIVGGGELTLSIERDEHATAELELELGALTIDGGLTSMNDLECPAGTTRCGATCCPTAHLYVYLCPDFNQGCTASAFRAGETCAPITSTQGGRCYDTGLTVAAGRSYAVASCQGCPSDCSGTTSFSTPDEGFDGDGYYPGIFFYCKTPCEPPARCP